MSEFEYLALAAAAKKRKDQATPKGFGTRLKENLIGDNDPTTQNFGEKIGTWLNKGGESMTMGLVGDEASAAVESILPGVDYGQRRDHYRQQEENLERTNPGAALVADIAGGFAMPVAGLGAVKAGAKLLPAMGASAAGTGLMSGTYGFMEGEGGFDNRAQDAKADATVGAGIGAAIPLLGRGVQKTADALVQSKAVKAAAKGAPSTDELRAAGRAAYQLVDDAGVQIKPESFSKNMSDIAARLSNEGLDNLPGPGSLTPQSARALQIGREMGDAMANEPSAALPFSSLDKLRRHASTASGNMSNATDSALGTKMVGEIDNFVESLTPDDLVDGNPEALKSAIGKARDVWARMSRSQTIDGAIEQSGNYLSNETSGLKNQFARILRSDKLSRGFSDAEKDMMRKVTQSTGSKRALDLLGGGMGTLGTMATGAGIGAAGGPAGGAIGTLLGAAVASGATKASEALTRRQANALRAVVANGGLKEAAKGNPAISRIIEQLLRQNTAATLQ